MFYLTDAAAALAANLSEKSTDWRRANGMANGAPGRRCLKSGSAAAFRAE